MRPLRPLALAAAGAALLAATASSSAAPSSRAAEKKACIAANEGAQKLRREGKLRAAREQLLLCARSDCPGVVRQDCAQWLNEVVTSTPSVVVAARDTSGKETLNVKVTLDGELVLQKLDGKSFNIDPGVHSFKYESEDGIVVEEDVGIREGEKNRVLYVAFHKPAPPDAALPPPPASPDKPALAARPTKTTTTTKSGVPAGAFVFGGIGLVGMGVGTYFLLSASSDASSLRNSCAPSCSHSDVNSARGKATIADVAFVAGGISLVAAVWMVLSRPSAERVVETTSAWRVDVHPAPGGGAASVGGTF